MTHVIIGRGQLGSAAAIGLRHDDIRFVDVPWHDAALARDALSRQIQSIFEKEAVDSVLWCAGAGFVGTTSAQLREECEVFRHALEVLRQGRHRPERLFFASSAGGVYGGNSGLCDETTTPIPLNDYGRSKLEQESIVAEWGHATDVNVLIGRISNLFGPRQNLAKPQGFVSHLLRATVLQRPVVFTVPGSTIRDFAYADDVGRQIARWAVACNGAPRAIVKILASERSVSLAHVTAMAARITRRPSRVLFARATSSDQPATIRFVSRVDAPPITSSGVRPLEHGLWLTWTALMRRGASSR
jgi:UDP-glucose 4-epimerase